MKTSQILDLCDNSHPVLIYGPTASGKTSLGIEIARTHGGVIVNADAIQVYAQWRVLSARPDPDELSQAEHRLYGHVGLFEEYSVGHWLREVAASLADGARPIFVGGTGLYFQALTRGLAEIPPVPERVKQAADALEAANGPEIFATSIAAADPETASKTDLANPARTRRAWEVLEATGKGLSQWHKDMPAPLVPPDRAIALNIVNDVDWLNDRIAKRFGHMVDKGALDECKAAIAAGYHSALPSCQAIGAVELISYLNGEIPLEAAIDTAVTKTRQYAKRQRTWARSKMKQWHQVVRNDQGYLLTS